MGANDGLVSVASLMLGVGGGTDHLHLLVLAGLAGLVGGALSMACGEYISVSSQRSAAVSVAGPEALRSVRCFIALEAPRPDNFWTFRDAEQADIDKEKAEQAKGPEARAHELEELAQIYEERGLSSGLARQARLCLCRPTNKHADI